MNKLFFIGLMFILCLGLNDTLSAADATPPKKPLTSCKFCGMSPDHFTWSRVIIEYEDGTIVKTCSLRCGTLELTETMARKVKKILVGDYATKELIDAETAIWVVGGDKHGVMAKTGKWAFAKKEDAEKFVKEHGGVITNFGAALDAAYKDISEGIQKRRERDRAKLAASAQNKAEEKTSEQKSK